MKNVVYSEWVQIWKFLKIKEIKTIKTKKIYFLSWLFIINFYMFLHLINVKKTNNL